MRLLLGSLIGAVGLVLLAHIISIHLLHVYRLQLRVGGGVLLLVVFALACIAVALWQVQSGLSPFDRLRAHLSAVRHGRGRRIEGNYPSEVEPLVNDLNALLEHREGIVRRALATAGDLAHGLKTPLAVLSQEADRAEAAGQPDLAAAIRQQLDRMRRQVDYHLARARAAASGSAPGARCLVIASAEGLSRTLLRLHAGRGIAIDLDVSPEHAVRCEREDLDEMLGNLLDNACKWARSRVAVASSQTGSRVVTTVEDDGPGLDPSMWDAVLRRGVRADEAAPGSGLGLAIVRDLAALYGGSIALDRSPLGGLRASLDLPSG